MVSPSPLPSTLIIVILVKRDQDSSLSFLSFQITLCAIFSSITIVTNTCVTIDMVLTGTVSKAVALSTFIYFYSDILNFDCLSDSRSI